LRAKAKALGVHLSDIRDHKEQLGPGGGLKTKEFRDEAPLRCARRKLGRRVGRGVRAAGGGAARSDAAVGPL
jgi:hypothetical protein